MLYNVTAEGNVRVCLSHEDLHRKVPPVKPCGGVSHASPHRVTFVRLRDPLVGPFEGERLVA